MGKNWDKPFTKEEFQKAWMGHTVAHKGKFHEYHDIVLHWGDTHVLIGENRSSSGVVTAYPKYIHFCMLMQSPLMKVLK
jgi:hypothetical protein